MSERFHSGLHADKSLSQQSLYSRKSTGVTDNIKTIAFHSGELVSGFWYFV